MRELRDLFESELPGNFDDQLLTGKVMRRLEGRINPALVKEVIRFINPPEDTPSEATQPMIQYYVTYQHENGVGWVVINRSHPVRDQKDLEMIIRSIELAAQEKGSKLKWVCIKNIQRLPI